MKKMLAALGLGALIVGLGAGAVAWAEPGGAKSPDGTKRKAVKECLKQVRNDNPDATRSQVFELAKPCLQQAGVAQEKLDRVAKRIECRKQANIDHPDATPKQLRAAIKACLGA